MNHTEKHRTHRIGWLRAAVLGANDGIVSTASLVLGVAAAGVNSQGILVTGVAGLVAGAMSMAAGEYVSVSSQADTERADLRRESMELDASPEHEHAELAAIYVKRGLDTELASNVATQLMQHDALGAHARDELGISDTLNCPTCASRVCLCRHFCGGRFSSASGRYPVSCFGTYVGCLRQFAFISRTVGFTGRKCRWRTCDFGSLARHLLGRIGNGIDSWSWSDLWGGCLSPKVLLE